MILTAALLFHTAYPGHAAQITEPIQPTEETAESVPATEPTGTETAETEPVSTEETTDPTESPTEESTEPQETEIQERIPDEAWPAETVPEETLPEDTVPEESLPEERLPEETLAEESVNGEGAFAGAEAVLSLAEPVGLPEGLPWNLYFGLLHAHTNISDGLGTVEEAFLQASGVEGLDFFAVTDHSNSFDNANAGAITLDGTAVSTEWAAGKAAASAVTDGDFVGIFGYEMTWQEGWGLGHINTFNTPGWQSRNQEDFSTLTGYYDALTTVPGSISQFNHPGPDYGEFENFTHYSAEYDKVLNLLEVGGEGNFTAYSYYTKALDAGWHVAPTNNRNEHNGNWGTTGTGRTVILAKNLTESSLYEAMSQRRVYATEDNDLSIFYTLDGHIMGSIIGSGNTHRIQVWLADPTDFSPCTLQVIADGGTVVTSQSADAAGLTELTVPGGYGFYYLRITQADGDIAVTAPVWTEDYRDMGISSFTADTQVPVQGKELTLTVTLFNDESLPLVLQTAEIYADEEKICNMTEPGTVASTGSFSLPVSYIHDGLGSVTFRAVVTGTVNGSVRTWEKTLTLSFRPKNLTADILVDGSHSSLNADNLQNLYTLAGQYALEVTVFTDTMPQSGKILIVPPPERAFDEEFLLNVAAFVKTGGTLVVCGTADSTGETAFQLNRLLSAAGSSMWLFADTAVDEIHNGGSVDALYPAVFNQNAELCQTLTSEQYYVHVKGCTVNPGSGTWLVKGEWSSCSTATGESAPVLMAWEKPSTGGTILAAGTLFLEDSAMPLPKNRWDPSKANQTILETLLGIKRAALTVSPIGTVRKGEAGTVYRVKGYATSGTANKYNTFPETLYLQDDTGGIALVSFRASGIPVGTPLEATGYLDKQGENPVLSVMDYRVLPEASYRYDPDPMEHKQAMNYAARGGSLTQIQAKVTSVTFTGDGLGVSRFTLTDANGDKATVIIEDNILSGSRGTNTLAKQVKAGRQVRATGLLHKDSNGISVLRVRNCEEVVYVPPVPRPGQNPPTGDPVYFFAGIAPASAATLAGLLYRRPGKRKSRAR